MLLLAKAFLRSSFPAVTVVLFVFSSCCSSTFGEDTWSFLRGPNFDGHADESGIVDSWQKDGPPVLWVQELGQSYSGFVGRGSRVFTQYQTTFGQYVVCLNADTGEEIWSHRYAFPYESAGMYPGPRSTPTLFDDHVFFTGPSGQVGCLTQSNGRVVWSRNIFEDFDVKMVDFGFSCSPTVADNCVYLPVGPPNASMVALSAESGEVVWRAGDAPGSHVPAMPIELGDWKLLVGLMSNHLVIHDRKNGRRLAQLKLSSGYDEHAAWPIYSEPYLWISGPFQAGSRLFKLVNTRDANEEQVPDDATPLTLEPIWQSKTMSNDVVSSVLVDGFIYGFDLKDIQSKPHRPSRGQFKCIELSTGTERWAQGELREHRRLSDEDATLDSSIGHASVIAADGKLILFNDMGEVILLRTNPDRCEVLARVRVLADQIVWTQPMLLNGRLYLRNHSRAVCLHVADQSQLDESNLETISIRDIPQSEYIDWTSILLPVEPEFAMDSPTKQWLWNWYFTCIAIGWFAAPTLAVTLLSIGRFVRRDWLHRGQVRNARRLLTFAMGAAGTTFISQWCNDFVFTWPLCLAVAFETVVGLAGPRGKAADPERKTRGKRWIERLALCGFLLLCVAYYWICRRLSLAAEWPFLIGFLGSFPVLLAERSIANRDGWTYMAAEWLLGAVAFSAFYGVSVLVIEWKFGITMI